jgi:hypothetical protein
MRSLDKLQDIQIQRQVRRHLQTSIPAMDLQKIITELQSEKHRLDEAIQALERLSTVSVKSKRRGRPPRWLSPKSEAVGNSESGDSVRKGST